MIFTIIVINKPSAVNATESNTWVIPAETRNNYQMAISVSDNEIIQQGDHIKGTNTIKYRTTGYYMTLVEYNTTGTFNCSNKILVPVKVEDRINGSRILSTYYINRQVFISAMQQLGVTSQTISQQQNGYITVYLNNEFEIFNPQNDTAYKGYTGITGYQEILNAGKRITGGAGWSSGTQEILESYYNFPWHVYPTLFNVEVIAIDEEGNELGVLKTGDKGMYKESYPLNSTYTAPSKYVKSNITYEAKDVWYYKYTGRTDNQVHRSGNRTGRTIDCTLPDAMKDSKVKIYVVYESKPKATIVFHAVDIDSKTIIKTNLYRGTVTASEQFSKVFDSSIITTDQKYYKKSKNFSYNYIKEGKTSPEPEKPFSTSKDTDPVSFTIPEDIKDGSTIIVSVYYMNEIPLDIPVTVQAVVEGSGVTIQTISSGRVGGGKPYSYDITDKLESGMKSYSYTGKWDWSYKINSGTNPIRTTNGSGLKVSFDAPSSGSISGGIIIKVYYKEISIEDNDIALRVIMVNSSGALVNEISNETVTRNQVISKTPINQKYINGVFYKYLNKWEYVYETSTGTKNVSSTGSTALFTIPSTTKLASTVILKFYYESDQVIEIPQASSPISVSLDTPAPYAVINGDSYHSPYFTSKQGIASTESQHVYVKAKDYLLGYTLVNRVGKIEYSIPVTKHYTIKYQSATPVDYGGPKEITEIVEDRQIIKVERAYSFWEITNLEFYYIGYSNIYNYSLPGGSVNLTSNNAYLNIPSLVTWHSGDIKDHVIDPVQVRDGINIIEPSPIVSTTSKKPSIEFEDLTSYALERTDEIIVKNDYLAFKGSVVLTSEPVEKITQKPDVSMLKQSTIITHDKALYTDGKLIDAVKENGNYLSSGSVTYYQHPHSINSHLLTRTYAVNVNNVTIHTPVICDPIITADNESWAQVIKPVKGAVQIVLDPDTTLNDFTVKISNTLEHSNRLGYFTRDFSRSLIDPENISYIAKKNGLIRNEMKLTFDVYVDTLNDKIISNDQFIKAGTWIVMARSTMRFYVPLWVQEGIHTAEFRSIAVNGEDKLNKTETTRNANLHNYVATQTQMFQITGRIYGMTLYDVSDYPRWEDVFRVKNTMLLKLFEGKTDGTKRISYNADYAYYYSVGTKNQYGNTTGRYNKFTVPLVNGSHPKQKNLGVLKTGYAIRFMLDTIGEMYDSGSYIKITPTFYHVDAEGKGRKQVDLYYKEEINGVNRLLVKVGEGIDLVNIQSGTTGNIYSRIPDHEIKQTAAVLNTTYSKVANQKSSMYSYSQIKIQNAFRTFIGTDYANLITSLSSFQDVKDGVGHSKLKLSKYIQRWYGTYKLPTNVHVVSSGYDVKGYMDKHGIDYSESFWLKDGYIVVNFSIVTVDKDGNENLSYINANNYLNNSNCSMWVTEGAALQKHDNEGNTFNFKAGDFIVYYTDKKSSDDYSGNLYK